MAVSVDRHDGRLAHLDRRRQLRPSLHFFVSHDCRRGLLRPKLITGRYEKEPSGDSDEMVAHGGIIRQVRPLGRVRQGKT
jgi:hypothetical protein